MPQNPESSIPLDDEDILDLTEVVEPEKEYDGPPEPGRGGGVDFGAELDALLDSLAPGGTVSAPSTQVAEAAASKSPVAAPIKNQTPVTHRVDPNEEMTMPETSDIDSLLAELGAQIPAEDPFDLPAEEAPAPKAVAPIGDFGNLLALSKAAEAQKAAEEAAAAPVAVAPVVVAPPAVTAPATAEPAAPAAAEPVAAAPEVAPGITVDDVDSLDLNELDALLDDILAAAPEMSAPAQRMQSAPATVPTIAPPIIFEGTPADEPVEEPARGEAGAFPEDDGLPEVIAVPEAALMPNTAPDSSLDARVRRLEDAVEVLETESNNQLSESMVNALIDAKLAALVAPGSGTVLSESMVDALIDAKLEALLAPGSGIVTKIVGEMFTRLAAPEADGESAAEFREKLEKMAAAAAAKVIREEIAALMSE